MASEGKKRDIKEKYLNQNKIEKRRDF